MKKIWFLMIALLTWAMVGYAQNITFSGYLKEKNTSEPVPFVNVWVKGTYNGIASNENGFFTLQARVGDTLAFSSIGYKPAEYVITKLQNRPLTYFLNQDVHALKEVSIKPDKDFVKELLKKILNKKDENASIIYQRQNFKTLSKTTIYVALDSSRINNKVFDSVNVITNDEKDLFYTPLFLSEEANKVVDNNSQLVYSNKDGIFPKLNQTLESILSQYLVVDLDFYKNQIYIFDRGFVSPLSNTALLHYNIYFSDSTKNVQGQKFYNFSFVPKNKFAPLFTGKFTVESESLALTHIQVYFKKEANVNFVDGFKGEVTYTKQNDGLYFMNKQENRINISVKPERDTTLYSSTRVDNVSSGAWLVNKTTLYSTEEELDRIDPANWRTQEQFDFEKLDEDEYKQVNAIKQKPVVKSIDAIGGMVLTSYFNFGYIDVGPVFDIYSTNDLEGNRYTVPLRTGEKVFKHLTIGGFIGYGSKSKETKYGANFAWEPFKNDNYVVRFNYSDDYNLISQDKFLRFIKKNPNTKGNGNFIAALTTRERDPYLKEEKSFMFRLEHNANKNFDVEVSPYFTMNYDTPEVHFIHNGIENKKYNSYGALLNFRFAFKQHYDKLYFARVYYMTQIPVLNISMDVGKVHLSEGPSEKLGMYVHFHGAIQGLQNLGPIAMRYMINGGYLFGDAPYELLDMPVGSQSYGYAKYRYNLLYHATFANNLYTNAHIELSGGGIILNYLPLIRRLKLREIVSLKTHYGVRNNAYQGVFELPAYYNNELSYPYAEMGVGLTNIFKLIRVEYIRQIGDYYKKDNIAYKHGIRFRVELSF